MARMTRTNIIKAIAAETGLKHIQVAAFLDNLKELAIQEVKTTGEFIVPGFGRLVKTFRNAREGRNPATGEVIIVPAKTVIRFRLGKSILDAVAVSNDLSGDVSEAIEHPREYTSDYDPYKEVEEAASEEDSGPWESVSEEEDSGSSESTSDEDGSGSSESTSEEEDSGSWNSTSEKEDGSLSGDVGLGDSASIELSGGTTKEGDAT